MKCHPGGDHYRRGRSKTIPPDLQILQELSMPIAETASSRPPSATKHTLEVQDQTMDGCFKNRGTPKWMVYNGKPY